MLVSVASYNGIASDYLGPIIFGQKMGKNPVIDKRSGFFFVKFLILSLLAATFWNACWGVLVYIIGEEALSLVGIRFVLLAIFLWIVDRIWNNKGDKGSQDIDVPTP